MRRCALGSRRLVVRNPNSTRRHRHRFRPLCALIDQGAKWPEAVTVTARAVGIADNEATASKRASSHPVFEMIRRGNRAGIVKAVKDPSVRSVRDESGNTPLIQ